VIISDIDCSFFVVTADLWSPDGHSDRNLVVHPTSSDRYSTAHAPKKRRPNHPATPYSGEDASPQTGAPSSRYSMRLPVEDQVCVMRWRVSVLVSRHINLDEWATYRIRWK
jgi:hypothetical protein